MVIKMNDYELKEYLKEVIGTAVVCIKDFVKKLGFDEQEYSNLMNIPELFFAIFKDDTDCIYLPTVQVLNNAKINNIEQFYDVVDKGAIFVSKTAITQNKKQAIFGFIRELLYANNNVMSEDYEYRINAEKSRLERTTSEQKIYFLNYCADNIKGSIDYSRKSLEEPKEINLNEMSEDKDFLLKFQRDVYKSLVFLTTFSAIEIHNNKNKSIMDTMEKFIDTYMVYKEDSLIMKFLLLAEIILENEDEEVFKCLIDPVTYTLGDIHYADILSFFTIDQMLSLRRDYYLLDINTYGKSLKKKLD